MRLQFFMSSLLLLGSSLPAQKSKVLPDGLGLDKAAGGHPISTYFGGTYSRNMEVFDKAHTNITTAVLTEIQYRRSGSSSFAKVTKDVTLRLGYTGYTPGRMPARFSAVPNLPMVEVFKGKLILPQSTPPVVGLAPWAFGIKFNKPYLFIAAKGNLVVDIEASSSASTSWWIDALLRASDWRAGKSRSLGLGCKGSNALLPTSILDRPHLAAPGRMMRMVLTQIHKKAKPALSEKFAIHFLGASSKKWGGLQLPYTLPAGCKLYTGIDLMQVVPLETPEGSTSLAWAHWPIPAGTTFAGAILNSQWLLFDLGANAMDLVFSDGQELTIGTAGTSRYPAQSIYTQRKGMDHAFQSAYSFAPVIRLVGFKIN